MNKPTKIKDKDALAYIEHLEFQLEKFKKSPYCASYLNLKTMVDRLNLKMVEPAEDDDDSFKAAMKMADQVSELVTKMDVLRGKMSPEEKKEVDLHPTGLAERMAMQAKEKA